jgi:hypothetical protein
MALEIQVLAWDRNKNVVGLNYLHSHEYTCGILASTPVLKIKR